MGIISNTGISSIYKAPSVMQQFNNSEASTAPLHVPVPLLHPALNTYTYQHSTLIVKNKEKNNQKTPNHHHHQKTPHSKPNLKETNHTRSKRDSEYFVNW